MYRTQNKMLKYSKPGSSLDNPEVPSWKDLKVTVAEGINRMFLWKRAVQQHRYQVPPSFRFEDRSASESLWFKYKWPCIFEYDRPFWLANRQNIVRLFLIWSLNINSTVFSKRKRWYNKFFRQNFSFLHFAAF